MATVVESAPTAPPLSKHDKQVLHQLAQASIRVRRLDLLRTTLMVLVASLGYAVLMLALDLWLELPALVRIGAFALFGVALLGYLAWQCRALLLLRVNPYYAARQLEKTLPNAKGSVVNWLDLHDEPLPQAIRASLGARAARDLEHADVDRALARGNPYWLLVCLGVLGLALLVLFISGPQQFTALLARAFLPFQEVALVPKTEITLLDPKDGDLTVAEKQSVKFRVLAAGRVPALNQPDSMRLLYRYSKSDQHQKQNMQPLEDGEWTATLVGDQIPSPGIYYKIAGGDAETPEYFIKVQSAPMATGYTITYLPRSYRPWAKLATKDVHSPVLKEYAGTEVQLKINTNRQLQSGYLELTFSDQDRMKLDAKPLAGEPQALAFQFPLLKSGTFSLRFKSKQGESNIDLSPHPISVAVDATPTAQIDSPAAEIQLPANGVLKITGQAEDFDEQHIPPSAGLKTLQVQMKVVKGAAPTTLQAKVYRQGKSLELTSGRYPKHLVYLDHVDLSQLRDKGGKPFQAKEGTEIEYWLEAIDICDYPVAGGNIGKSKVHKLTILPPEDQKKAESDKQQAQKEQDDHDKKQEESLQQQKKDIEEKQKQEKDGNGQDNKGQKNGASQPSPEEQKNNNLFEKLEKMDQDKKNPGKAKDDGAEKNNNSSNSEPNPMPKQPSEKASNNKKQDQAPPQDKNQGKGQGSTQDNAGKGAGQEKPQPSAKGGNENDGGQATGKGSAQKQPPQQGEDSKPGGAKDNKNGTGGDMKPSESKQQPPSKPDSKGQGQAKGEPGDGSANQPSKPPGMGDPKGMGDAKGSAKGSGPSSTPKGGNNNANASAKDLANFLEKLNKAGPDAQKKFLDEMKKLDKDFAKDDPDLKKQKLEDLKNLLKEYQKAPAETQKKIEQELDQIGKDAKDEELKKAATDLVNALKNSKGKNPMDKGAETTTKTPGSANPTGQNTGAIGADGDPDKANADFAKHLGSLQLENLIEKVDEYKKLLTDKEVQAKLKLTPEQIKSAENYLKQLVDKAKQESHAAPGSVAGTIGSKGPSQIGGPNKTNNPAGISVALPPPEYQQAFKNLTAESGKKKAPQNK